MAMDEIDYRKFYDDELYLIDEVGPRFRETGALEPADFYTLLIWKAERVKNHHKKRLTGIAGSFETAVRQIASELHNNSTDKHRLELLLEKWWFSLPTATAILTILYPDTFTVYDWRVCDEVGIDYEPWCSRSFSDALWSHYELFKQAVINQTPAHLSLRDKDRFLIGRSTRKSIEQDWKS
jgi:hypothetical protein